MRGQGTFNDPYILETVADVQSIADGTTAYYIVGNDIDFAGQPLSTDSTKKFYGKLDGQFKRFKNVVHSSYWFERISGEGTYIKNLGIENITVNVVTTGAPFARYLTDSALMEQCWATGKMIGAAKNNSYSGGGLVYVIDSAQYNKEPTTVKNCWSKVDVYHNPANTLHNGIFNYGGLASSILRILSGGMYITRVTIDKVFCYGVCYRKDGTKGVDDNGTAGPVYGKVDPSQYLTMIGCYYDRDIWDIPVADTTYQTGLTTDECKIESNFLNYDFTNVWKINNNLNFWRPLLRRFNDQGSWATTVKSVIEENAMQAIRDYIQSNWNYIELASYLGTVWKRLPITDPRIQWTHTPGSQTMQLTIVISGTDSDVTLPLKIGKISMFNVPSGGSALVSELFTEQTISIIENVLTLTYQLQIPKVG